MIHITFLLTAISITVPSTVFARAYRFGIIPQQKPSVILQNWSPITKLISEQGIELEIERIPNIPSFLKMMKRGEFDFVYTNPYSYVQVSRSVGYKAFASANNKKIKGIFIVKKGSPFRTREDLSGKTISFPKGAFAANALLRAGLKQIGVDVKTKFTRTHNKGYVKVFRGLVDASGGVGRTFHAAPKAMKSKLRILWTSPGYTPHAFASHPRVPQGVVQKVQSIMLEISNDPNTLKFFQAMKINHGVQKAIDSDWDDVRELEPFLKTIQ